MMRETRTSQMSISSLEDERDEQVERAVEDVEVELERHGGCGDGAGVSAHRRRLSSRHRAV